MAFVILRGNTARLSYRKQQQQDTLLKQCDKLPTDATAPVSYVKQQQDVGEATALSNFKTQEHTIMKKA
jgi:hypothetical protein